MSEERSTGEQGAADSEVFDEWLTQTAESKGVRKKELMDQMLSSYWILDELTELVEGTETERNSGHPSTEPTEPASEPDIDPEPADLYRSDEEPTTIGETDYSTGERGGATETAPGEENIRQIQTAIRKLIESQWAAELQQPADDDEASAASTSGDGDADGVSELRERVETLASQLEDVESRQNSQAERFTGELQLVLDRVDELERQQNRHVDESEIAALSEKIDDLNERFGKLHTATADFEAEIDREFDSIEELFRRVLDALNDLNAEIETATESYRKELQPIQQRQAERKQLEALKTEALNLGVRKGVCESCNGTIDLTLLESPTCPNCGTHLIGIEDGGWNPFRPATFETEGALADREGIRPSDE